jgi:hypothetical protein
MWQYAQSTGNLTAPDGTLAGQGYSGNGANLDSPAAEGVIGHGPIPQGDWLIGKFTDHPKLGPISAPLMPCAGNTMDGRQGGFFIHGDNKLGNHSASDGCIVLAGPLRELIAASNDTLLQVIA